MALNSAATHEPAYLVIGDGATFVATSSSGDWPATTRLVIESAAGVETSFTPTISTVTAVWALTVAEVTALLGTKTSGVLRYRITHGTGDDRRGKIAGELSILTKWRGVRGTQSLGAVVVGPEGPTAVSADADNVASLGTDGLIYVAPGAGTVSSVNGQTGAVVLTIPDSPDDIGAATAAQGALADTASQPGHTHTGVYAPASHTHAQADVTGLVTALSGKADTGHLHTGVYAPVLGADDNYVTDAEKVKLSNLSGTNTGDQTLPTWSTISGKPAVVGAGATQADARTAIGAGTSSLVLGTGSGNAAAGDHVHTGVYAPASHSHAASDVTSGTMATARLGSGTANGTTFLRGDQTWATPSGGSDPWTQVRATSDTTNDTTSDVNVSGLTISSLADGDYEVFGLLKLTTVATTTGIRYGISLPSGVTGPVRLEGVSTASSIYVQYGYGSTVNTSPGVPYATDPIIGTMTALLTVSSMSGNIEITIKSEVASSQVAVKAGSFLRYRKIA